MHNFNPCTWKPEECGFCELQAKPGRHMVSARTVNRHIERAYLKKIVYWTFVILSEIIISGAYVKKKL